MAVNHKYSAVNVNYTGFFPLSPCSNTKLKKERLFGKRKKNGGTITQI